MPEIVLNGSKKTVAPGTTVSDLLVELAVPRDGIAVAIDASVVPKSAHDQTELREGARVEVIRAVGGG